MLKVQSQQVLLTSDKSELPSFSHKISVVACFIESEQKILLLKTDSEHKFQNKVWGAPGGKLEAGEAPIDAALRELQEETGLRLNHDQLGFVIKLYVRAKDLDYEFYIYKSSLDTPVKNMNIVIDSKEHNDFVWLPPKEALALELIFGEKELIQFLYPELLS